MSQKPIRFTIKTRSQSRLGDPDASEEEVDVQPGLVTDAESPEDRGECGQQAVLDQSEESTESSVTFLEPSSEEEEDADAEEDNMADHRGPLITPGKFRGGLEENVEEYLAQFERVAKANGWEDPKKKVILPCYLEGAALKWFENLECRIGDNLTWNQIKDGMKETFQGIAWEEQVEFMLRMRMQGESEPVEAYVQDVINLCAKVDGNMAERTKIKHVLRGLKPTLIEKVMMMENATLADLLANIRKVETARFMAGQRVDHLLTEPALTTQRPSTSAEEGRAFSSTLESKVENLTSEFAKLGMRLLEQHQQERNHHGPEPKETNPQGTTQRYTTPRERRGRGRGRGADRGRTSDGRIICYNCGRPGHYAMNCQGENPRVLCYNCNRPGHYASNCPNGNHGNQGNEQGGR